MIQGTHQQRNSAAASNVLVAFFDHLYWYGFGAKWLRDRERVFILCESASDSIVSGERENSGEEGRYVLTITGNACIILLSLGPHHEHDPTLALPIPFVTAQMPQHCRPHENQA